MDISLDVDSFEVPLNEKRTYSIVEVLQVKYIVHDLVIELIKIMCIFLALATNIQRNFPRIPEIIMFITRK